MKVDFKKQNVRTFEIFYESTGLTEANFLRPLAKLCVQDAGRTPKNITVSMARNYCLQIISFIQVLSLEKIMYKIKHFSGQRLGGQNRGHQLKLPQSICPEMVNTDRLKFLEVKWNF